MKVNMKHCPNCGAKLISKMGESSWTRFSVCRDSYHCRSVYQTNIGDGMGGSSDDTFTLDSSLYDEYNRMIKDDNIVRIPD